MKYEQSIIQKLKNSDKFLNKLFNLRLNETMFVAIEYFTLHYCAFFSDEIS